MRHTRLVIWEKNEIIAAMSLALPINRDTIAKFSIILWWKLKGAPTFPIMSHVARSVLCIPASSSKSESNFSDAGNTLTKKRSGLKPTIVNDLLFALPGTAQDMFRSHRPDDHHLSSNMICYHILNTCHVPNKSSCRIMIWNNLEQNNCYIRILHFHLCFSEIM